MSWGENSQASMTEVADAPTFGADYYRNLLSQKRELKPQVRVSFTGKENTGKTGLAISRARAVIGPDKRIVVIDVDGSALSTVATNFANDPMIDVIPIFDELDESLFNEDNTTNYLAVVEKVGWFVRLLAARGDENPYKDMGALIMDGCSTLLKWCEFAMRAALLQRGVIESEGDSFNQKEWRERNKMYRDILNRAHRMRLDYVAYTFHLKDVKEFMDIGNGSKGLMKVGEVPEWENGTKRLFSQQIFLARYTREGDLAAGVKADPSLADGEWVIRGTVQEMKGLHQEYLNTTHDVLRVKDRNVEWLDMPFLMWGHGEDESEDAPVESDEGDEDGDGSQ